MGEMKIRPAKRIRGQLQLPGDKSISHRVAMIAALANGVSRVSNFSTSFDCASTLACLRQLGVSVERKGQEVVIKGRPKLIKPSAPLDCGNSGSTIRMMAGVLAGQDFTSELTGDESLSSRPMRRIIEPLELMGAQIDAREGKPPLRIMGTNSLRPIRYTLPVASAQVKSCILFAALGTNGLTSVIESTQSRNHTELLFNGFGVPVTVQHAPSGNVISLTGPARFSAREMTVPGDVSSAAYFVAAAALLSGSDLTIERVGLNPTRAEFLLALQSWGARLSMSDVENECNEPVGTIRVNGGLDNVAANLNEAELSGAGIPLLIDELPLLAVVGTQLHGGLRIRDSGELRVKETDRLAATAKNLRAMGAKIKEYDDGLFVAGPTKLKGASLESYSDHRIAMAFAVAALIADGPSEIAGSQCVEISFPEFFDLLHSITEN
jgi:3-phosphoshikimate 1-carboxyvinyltransferase